MSLHAILFSLPPKPGYGTWVSCSPFPASPPPFSLTVLDGPAHQTAFFACLLVLFPSLPPLLLIFLDFDPVLSCLSSRLPPHPFLPSSPPLFPSILYVAVLLLLPLEICACCPSRQAAIPILCDLVGFVIPFPLSGCETMKVQVPLPVCLNPRRQFSSNLRFCYVAAFLFSVYLKPLVVARVTRVSS